MQKSDATPAQPAAMTKVVAFAFALAGVALAANLACFAFVDFFGRLIALPIAV